jgi:hypothetical protein
MRNLCGIYTEFMLKMYAENSITFYTQTIYGYFNHLKFDKFCQYLNLKFSSFCIYINHLFYLNSQKIMKKIMKIDKNRSK